MVGVSLVSENDPVVEHVELSIPWRLLSYFLFVEVFTVNQSVVLDVLNGFKNQVTE